jgi:hypothetical protein
MSSSGVTTMKTMFCGDFFSSNSTIINVLTLSDESANVKITKIVQLKKIK